MFNTSEQEHYFTLFVYLQLFAASISVIFVKISPHHWLNFTNISVRAITIIQFLTLWNLGSLPLTLNFYLKVNLIVQGSHSNLITNLAIFLLNSILVWAYLNIFTEQTLIRKDIADIWGHIYTIYFLVIALGTIFYFYPIPMFPIIR